jgi:hypothetical protein
LTSSSSSAALWFFELTWSKIASFLYRVAGLVQYISALKWQCLLHIRHIHSVRLFVN